MQPRKSSAFSSLPDAAAPLALTDLAICLKYLILWCNSLSHAFGVHLQRMCQMYLRLISFKTTDGRCLIYLPIPLNPLISFSFLQASATETSSSWSLGWKITSKTNCWDDDCSHSERRLLMLIGLTICPDGGGHCEHHRCRCGKQTYLKGYYYI